MYYKITNKESDVYKKLHELRTKEIAIGERNKKAIIDKIPYKWKNFVGIIGQQSFNRVTQYFAFKFEEPEKVDMGVWKKHKEYPECFVPDNRRKGGKEMQKFIDNLEKSSFFELEEIIGTDHIGRFTLPFLEIAGDILILYLDEKFEPKGDEFIEITSKEFEEIRKS